MTEAGTPSPLFDPSLMAGALPPQESRIDRLDMKLLQHDHVIIDGDAPPLYPPEDIGIPAEPNGHTISVLGELALPGGSDQATDMHIAILKIVRTQDHAVRYALQGLVTDEKGGAFRATVRPVSIGEPGTGLGRTLLGRNADAIPAAELWDSQTSYSAHVSSQQVELFATPQGVVVRDLSTNGTHFKTRRPDTSDTRFIADHTTYAEEMGRLRGLIGAGGEYAGRARITRNSEVRDGLVDDRSRHAGDENDIGAEAIVVDSTKPEDAPAYAKLYLDFEDKLAQTRRWSGRPLTEKDVLRAVYETVHEDMEYDLAYADAMTAAVKRITREQAGTRDINQANLKVNLSSYLEDGKGVCRHMALAVGWLGSRAKDAGLLTGRTTAEINEDTIDNSAHEWARYTAQDGKVYILDPAQQFFGTLAESLYGHRWHYFRKGEKQQYAQKTGKGVISGHDGAGNSIYDWSADSL